MSYACDGIRFYANGKAYGQHINTPYFLEYETTVKEMVQSLELTEVTPISAGGQQNPRMDALVVNAV